jgi:hypothetical protein
VNWAILRSPRTRPFIDPTALHHCPHPSIHHEIHAALRQTSMSEEQHRPHRCQALDEHVCAALVGCFTIRMGRNTATRTSQHAVYETGHLYVRIIRAVLRTPHALRVELSNSVCYVLSNVVSWLNLSIVTLLPRLRVYSSPSPYQSSLQLQSTQSYLNVHINI